MGSKIALNAATELFAHYTSSLRELRQMHHISWGYEVFGPFVDRRAETANQLLIKIAHHPIRNDVRVKVYLRKVRRFRCSSLCTCTAQRCSSFALTIGDSVVHSPPTGGCAPRMIRKPKIG